MATNCTVGLQRGRANCFWNVHQRLGMESISPWPYASSSKARLREVSQKVRRAWPDRKPGLPLAFSGASFVVPHGASDTLVHRELFLTTRPSSKGVLKKQHFLFKEIMGYYENNVDSLCKTEKKNYYAVQEETKTTTWRHLQLYLHIVNASAFPFPGKLICSALVKLHL